MQKFKDLIVTGLGEIINGFLESTRLGLDLGDKDFRTLLEKENEKIFKIVDHAITHGVMEQVNKDYLSGWLKISQKNQKTLMIEKS